VVCVLRFDRFARSVSDFVRALETFKALGIGFVSYSEQTPIHKHGVKSLTEGSRTPVYAKNDPFRSWPISANELEEVAMGSETNV